MLNRDADYFHELQTQTGWGRTLTGFAEWCESKPGWLVLDVGCGPGVLPMIFSRLGCRAVGADIDQAMFHPSPLHPVVAVADIYDLPFDPCTFDLITATNLLFLLEQPIRALGQMKGLLRPGGKVALLNPSENITEQAATRFAKERGLDGVARATLENWARRAENHQHWNKEETRALYANAGLNCISCSLKVGPGFARYSAGSV